MFFAWPGSLGEIVLKSDSLSRSIPKPQAAIISFPSAAFQDTVFPLPLVFFMYNLLLLCFSIMASVMSFQVFPG